MQSSTQCPVWTELHWVWLGGRGGAPRSVTGRSENRGSGMDDLRTLDGSEQVQVKRERKMGAVSSATAGKPIIKKRERQATADGA